MTEAAEARLVDLASATPAEWMALSTAAHWNQTEEDWRMLLSLGHGWGLRLGGAGDSADCLVASTLVLPYEDRFAWISMVLVLPDQRGKGLAARLLRHALQDLAARRLLPLLDATPDGRPVYLKQGFVDAWGFQRWRRRATANRESPAPEITTNMAARPLLEADWPQLQAADAQAFGASRLRLLRALAQRTPQAAWVAEGENALRGYVLAREGRTALQLGPLLADDEDTAIGLLAAALGSMQRSGNTLGRDVIVDLCDGRQRLAAWLRAQGFVPERPFTRMVHGAQNQAPGDARRVCLVAGPELG